jgi:hypothetical protein
MKPFQSLSRKTLIPLPVIALAAAGAVAWFAVRGGSGGGALAARPDSPTITAGAAIQAAVAHLPVGVDADRATEHATLFTYGAIANLRGSGRYASDYPVWTVSVAGSFRDRSHPPGLGSDDYGTDTVYLDGYTGAVIRRVHDSTPMPFPTPTIVSKRDAPLIDAAAAVQAVVQYARQSIDANTVQVHLLTFAEIPGSVSSLLDPHASDYPVWVVSASAAGAGRIHRTDPTTDTFYLDAYSGSVWLMDKESAATPTP